MQGRTFLLSKPLLLMKKFLLSLMLLSPLALFAQLSGSGFYRIQNYKTDRYFVMVDDSAWLITTASTQDINTGAFKLVQPFEERVATNPATICYLTKYSNYQYNVSGQGLDLYARVKAYLEFRQRSNGTYTIGGTGTVSGISMTKYLTDSEFRGDEVPIYTAEKNLDDYGYWWIRPINDKYYFGFRPTIKASLDGADSLYYTPFYASFPFAVNSNVKAYYITEVRDGYAKVKGLTYTVPGATPVFVECTSETATENKVSLTSSTATATGNQLKGVYFCNDVKESTGHRNVTAYNPNTMRVLGRAADGRLAFVKSTELTYIPANTCYLQVPVGSPNVIYVVKDIPSGIETVKAADVKPVKRGVYTLSGQRLGDTTEGLSKGVYIVNGRKTVVK